MSDPYKYLDFMIQLSKHIDNELELIKQKSALLECYVLLTDIKKGLQPTADGRIK